MPDGTPIAALSAPPTLYRVWKTAPKVSLHYPFCFPPKRIISVAMRISFKASGLTCLVLFSDYGADTKCWGHSHEMCLIVQGGK